MLYRYPGQEGSVHLETFSVLPFAWNSPALAEKYEGLREIRKVMTGALEVGRASKQIGSSLQAAVNVFLNPSLKPFIENVDLAELSITSHVEVQFVHVQPEVFSLEDVSDVSVSIKLAQGEKCVRCWRVLPEVGEIEATPDLCHRCADVVKRIDGNIGEAL
jgi:isoleucyl-tRNA synthetase